MTEEALAPEGMVHVDFWDSIERRLLPHFSPEAVSVWINGVKKIYEAIPESDIWPEGEADFERFILRLTKQMIHSTRP